MHIHAVGVELAVREYIWDVNLFFLVLGFDERVLERLRVDGFLEVNEYFEVRG